MSIFKRKPKEPTEAELARARMANLAQAMNERRPVTASRPPLRVVSSQSLESELTGAPNTGQEPHRSGSR